VFTNHHLLVRIAEELFKYEPTKQIRCGLHMANRQNFKSKP